MLKDQESLTKAQKSNYNSLSTKKKISSNFACYSQIKKIIKMIFS